MREQLLNEDGTPQRWTDGIPADALAIVAQAMGVTVDSILADEELQIDADARHHEWLRHNGRLVHNQAWLDYCTSQSGGQGGSRIKSRRLGPRDHRSRVLRASDSVSSVNTYANRE